MDSFMIEVNDCGKDVHILVITNYFTWYAQAIVTSSQTTNVQPQIIGQINYPLWTYQENLTDQGHNFKSDLLKELCETYFLVQILLI